MKKSTFSFHNLDNIFTAYLKVFFSRFKHCLTPYFINIGVLSKNKKTQYVTLQCVVEWLHKM